ncbi:hypothetical protein MVEN_01080000 [Mycena venus]|uniref:BTB domain-containing protein n=1 Tax=Mycena venus TaxID=2733690 RepID=A0A8H7CZJ0_9AGAR|nr:hypothetical protein MVEN_01080000 [Mycena venus]
MEVGPERVQGLWFDDGNLIIQAGNSQYRIFRGILAARSAVFQDMFSFPQPPDSELVEGCPLVYLSDSATEVTAFLRAIFDSESCIPPFPAHTDFDTICACLRLSHKYGVDYLRRRALVHLSCRYPTTLPGCDALEAKIISRSWKRPTNDAFRIFLVQLAREVDAPWILPYNFYLFGASFAKLGTAIFHGAVYNDIPVSLSREDQDAFLNGYFMQKEITKSEIFRFLWSPRKIEGCTSTVACLEARLNTFDTIHEPDWVSTTDEPLHAWIAENWTTIGICPSCLTHCRKAHQDARQAFWDRLPEIYGLPSWEQLERMKTEAIAVTLLVFFSQSIMEVASSHPERVQELWFDDGNLVIQAGNNQYRVFRGILAARSPVFKDMFSFPQPPDSDLVEGCPLVHLSDSAEEVTVFFRAIFDSESFMPPFPNQTDFDTVCGCLRLSHKYGVEYLRRRALVHLSCRYPTTLAECDAVEVAKTIPLSWKRPTSDSYPVFLLLLLREVDAIWLLPYLFYVLGVKFGELGMGAAIFHGAVYSGTAVGLSTKDQDAFLRGYFIQRDSTRNEILRFLWSPDRIEGCIDTVQCLQKRLDLFKNTCTTDWAQVSMPLHAWGAADWTSLPGICPSCLAHCKKAQQDARQAFWDKLPEIYGLPPWEQLEKLKTNDLAGAGSDDRMSAHSL